MDIDSSPTKKQKREPAKQINFAGTFPKEVANGTKEITVMVFTQTMGTRKQYVPLKPTMSAGKLKKNPWGFDLEVDSYSDDDLASVRFYFDGDANEATAVCNCAEFVPPHGEDESNEKVLERTVTLVKTTDDAGNVGWRPVNSKGEVEESICAKIRWMEITEDDEDE